jgi:hypothetical protein
MDLRRPVPLWALLLAILLSGSVAAGLVYLPRLLGPDFNLALSSNPMLVQAGNWNSSIVKVESVRGFVGVVSLGIVSSSGSGLTVELNQGPGVDNPQSQVGLGTTGNLTLNIRSTGIGDYPVKIIATGGSTSHYVDLVVRVQNLGMNFNPTTLTLARGTSGTVAISLTSLNGLLGNISLQAAVGYYGQSGLPFFVDALVNAHLGSSNIVLQSGKTATVILTLTVDSSDSPKTDSILVTASKNSWTFGPSGIVLTIV